MAGHPDHALSHSVQRRAGPGDRRGGRGRGKVEGLPGKHDRCHGDDRRRVPPGAGQAAATLDQARGAIPEGASASALCHRGRRPPAREHRGACARASRDGPAVACRPVEPRRLLVFPDGRQCFAVALRGPAERADRSAAPGCAGDLHSRRWRGGMLCGERDRPPAQRCRSPGPARGVRESRLDGGPGARQ
ncbi:hypothetical protein D9M69_561410 [compost metagenome]